MPRRLIAALALFWCASAESGAPTPSPVNQDLLHSARFWEAHDRGDLAQLALKKLVAARPDLPDALVDLGELDLRLNDFAAASQVESELTRRFPRSSAAADFATEVRLATGDRLQFASIRRLIEIGRTSEAQAQLKHLFPKGPPDDALGIDYYLLLTRTPEGAARARAGLQALAQRHADDPRYQLGLAQLLVRQGDSALEGVTLLQRLTERDDVRRDDVDRALASGLLRLGVDRAPPAAVSAYLARHSEDTEMTALRSEQQRVREERKLLSNVTLSRALPASQHALASELASAGGGAADRAEARRWLARSRASLDERQEARAAAELRAALAFSRGTYESEIGIARELDTAGASAEAGVLLADAARLAPQSSWLFETRVRWLIAHGSSGTALDLLRRAAVPAKVKKASRDALLAQALEEHAADEAKAGQLDAAMADLAAALQLAPNDAWMRYRLADDYRVQGDPARGRSLMSDGVQRAPDAPEMHYAQGLFLEHLGDYSAAYAAIEAVDPSQRTDGMNALRDRMQLARARADARRLHAAGDLPGARAALLEAEPIASRSFGSAAELAYSWIDLGDSKHGIGLVEPYTQAPGGSDPHVLLVWAEVLNDAEDPRLQTVLVQLRTMHLDATGHADLVRLQRSLDLREIRALERHGNYAEAARRLDALLAAELQDRQLRVARAELDLMAAHPSRARDRLAPLAAEDPDDLDVRLSYVRALTESGDVALARIQLAAIETRVPAGNEELDISLARRQLGLGDASRALGTLQPLLAVPHPRVDVLLLAGRAELAQHHLRQAREYFAQAAAGATGTDALAAVRAREAVDDRLQSSVTAGLLVWHQPGDPGMSQIDAVTMPSSWVFGQNDGARFVVRADAVWLDAGRWSTSARSPLLLGTIQAAGPAAELRYTDTQQGGVSPAVGYRADSVAADIGTTPLGFLLPNVVGGFEWTPTWRTVDLTLGVARRAVTSSELSYAGLRDPVTGTAWGGVVQTGPYAGFGIYRANYDVSASVRWVEITGTHVPDNQLAAARVSGSWKFLSLPDMRADAGVTLMYWNYQHNLSNYTFGSGGYYSPQSYVSLATPIELTGNRAGWSYKLRAAVSYTVSQVSGSAFYPDDPTLQAEAAQAPLPPGYSSPYYPGYHSSGFGFSLYAATERQLSDALVVGFMLDLDRTDYYHPTSIGIYLRHAFRPWTTHSVSPPRPVAPYNP